MGGVKRDPKNEARFGVVKNTNTTRIVLAVGAPTLTAGSANTTYRICANKALTYTCTTAGVDADENDAFLPADTVEFVTTDTTNTWIAVSGQDTGVGSITKMEPSVDWVPN